MLVQNPPMRVLTTEELDRVYDLPYARTYHPMYEELGGVPGIEEVEFSIAHNRGCFGNCNFCSIAFHQGRKIAVRSEESVLREAELLTTLPNFKGYIHDVGGPTANFRQPSCTKQIEKGLCVGKKCLAPTPLQGAGSGSSGVSGAFAESAAVKGVKKDVYPLWHPVRLHDGGQGRQLFQGAGGVPCQRAAESGPGALQRRRFGLYGQAPH